MQTFVRVGQRDAFDVFTLELDAWWRQGPAYRVGGKHLGPMHLEPKLGGRVFQAYGPSQDRLHEIGKITAWDPPARFAFTWRGINFKASDSDTTVEVWFEATADGTRVILEHRGFAALRPDHPVRHDQTDVEFLGRLGRWWGSLATALREFVEHRARDRTGVDLRADLGRDRTGVDLRADLSAPQRCGKRPDRS